VAEPDWQNRPNRHSNLAGTEMEEFILNQQSGQEGSFGRRHRRGRDFAQSRARNPRLYAVELPPASTTTPRGCTGPEPLLDIPCFRLRSPDPSAVGQPVFLTWLLRDSVPDDQLDCSAAPSTWKAFASVDRYLDEARRGPLYLRQREVAAMVVETVRAYGSALRQYDLHSYVVMPNHIHLLLTPLVDLRKLTQRVKGVIARRANELLDQTNAPFWDEANWEHLVGDNHELSRILQYIERNPVPVGMAREAADYPYSSAARGNRAQSA
jgi:putative transposase